MRRALGRRDQNWVPEQLLECFGIGSRLHTIPAGTLAVPEISFFVEDRVLVHFAPIPRQGPLLGAFSIATVLIRLWDPFCQKSGTLSRKIVNKF